MQHNMDCKIFIPRTQILHLMPVTIAVSTGVTLSLVLAKVSQSFVYGLRHSFIAR